MPDKVIQQRDPNAAILAVDLKCPQGFVLAGPPSMIAVVVAQKNSLSFVGCKDLAMYCYELEVLGCMKEKLDMQISLDWERMSDQHVLVLLDEMAPSPQ